MACLASSVSGQPEGFPPGIHLLTLAATFLFVQIDPASGTDSPAGVPAEEVRGRGEEHLFPDRILDVQIGRAGWNGPDIAIQLERLQPVVHVRPNQGKRLTYHASDGGQAASTRTAKPHRHLAAGHDVLARGRPRNQELHVHPREEF